MYFYVYCIFILCPLFNFTLHSTFSLFFATFEHYFLSPHLNSIFACFLILIYYTILSQFLLVVPLNFHNLLSFSFSHSHYVLCQFTLYTFSMYLLVSHNVSFFHFFVLFLITLSLLYVFLVCFYAILLATFSLYLLIFFLIFFRFNLLCFAHVFSIFSLSVHYFHQLLLHYIFLLTFYSIFSFYVLILFFFNCVLLYIYHFNFSYVCSLLCQSLVPLLIFSFYFLYLLKFLHFINFLLSIYGSM